MSNIKVTMNMSMLSPTELNAKNKGQVVDYALELQNRISVLEAKPMTDAVYRQKLLQLRESIAKLQAKSIADANEHQAKLTKLEAEYQFKTEELKLKYGSSYKVDLEEVQQAFNKLTEEAEKSLQEKESILQMAEAEMRTREENLKRRDEEVRNELKALDDSLTQKRNGYAAELQAHRDAIDKEHHRKLEEMLYKNKLELERNRQEFLVEFATQQDKLVVTNAEYQELVDFKNHYADKEITLNLEAIKEAVSNKEAELSVEHAKEINKLSNEKALLERDVEHLRIILSNHETTIRELRDQLALVPDQIRDAVASVNPVSVNNEIAKK